MAKTFKEYLKEISDQQMKDMKDGNAYNGGGPKQKKKAKAKDPKSQERKDAAVAKMNAEDKAARKAQADKFAAMKNEDLENNVLTTVENENGERHVVEVPIDHFKVNEGDDRIIFKGKEIDPDTIEYDMQDFSDMIAPIEYAKYTDGTEVDDEDLEALDELPAMQDWISTDYMDRRADQADMYEDAFDKADRITDPEELNLYGPEDIENNSKMSAEELKDELEQDIYHLMDKASDDFTDNDHIADEMGDYFANMHLKADDKTLSCYIAMRDLIDADPADVYETGKKCLKILGAQEHQDQEQGNKGPKGRPAADAYAGGMESTNNELARIKELAGASIDETYDDDDDFYEAYGELWWNEDDIMDEAEYQGRKVKLGKPMQGDTKKFKVYVKDPKTGNVKKVNFGHGGSSVKGKAMSIKKNNPKRRKSFRARHNCDNPGPRTKARYWSCRKW